MSNHYRNTFVTPNSGAGVSLDALSEFVELGGHEIQWEDGFMSFECRRCETSFDVPDIFQKSKARHAVAYQLYIFGHFRSNECPKKNMTNAEFLEAIKDFEDQPHPPNNPITSPNSGPKPGDVYWSNGNRDVYYNGHSPHGKNIWVDSSDGRQKTTKQLLKDLPDNEAEHFAVKSGLPGVAQTWKDMQDDTQQSVPNLYTDSNVGVSSIDDDTSSLSARERFARKKLDYL